MRTNENILLSGLEKLARALAGLLDKPLADHETGGTRKKDALAPGQRTGCERKDSV
jgi:hypothetical protein